MIMMTEQSIKSYFSSKEINFYANNDPNKVINLIENLFSIELSAYQKETFYQLHNLCKKIA